MNSLSKMKKQARQLQEQLSKMQEELETLEITGSAGNNLIQITLSGEKTLKKIVIDPACVDPEDVEGLQDLIMAAFADANKKFEERSSANSLLDNLPFSL